MNAHSNKRVNFLSGVTAIGFFLLSSCNPNNNQSNSIEQGFEVKFLVGSALEQFCNQAATQFNQQKPKLDNGKEFYLKCEAKGSGDVVNNIVTLAKQLQQGIIKADAPEFPSLISTDGEIYHAQLKYQIEQLFPGQNYIPEITDSPLLANSPMVFMVAADVAPALRKQTNIFKELETAKTYQDIEANSPALPIYYVHAAPTRSNSGLQTLIAQFVDVSGKRPEQLTVADIQKYQPQVQKIQSKVTRYGISTNSLAKDMVKNGSFWASIGSVYESSVIEANSSQNTTQTRYEAIYPQATFTSNMRAILPNAPWVNADEKAASEKVIEYLRSPQGQKIATDLGLRPGVPGIELGAKFSPQFGVDPNAKYDSLRAPKPEVVNGMLKSWQDYAKKPSQVVIVVDSSGSMEGNKLPSVQNTLNNYINSLGPKEKVALIDFDSEIRQAVIVDGTPQGKNTGLQFISGLKAYGGTRLYDATLDARNWLQKNLKPNAINAVIVLTDGEDSGSKISLETLNQELQKSGFNSDQRIAFFTIGYGNEGEFNPDVLKQIANTNGGYYRKGDPETISTVMSDLQLEF
ncbi:Mg-chelatase subunit ChlD [Aphanothece hegewaldii CCALA 016]|uniref:Mg-chelatase subunit ChlD n=1 Tax=Aphanothece hegewaldii CCALA 016 TaxID=2107694 RepID=A0A2T1M2D1_9CHRO|nr:VWA domain-containing protein [Aphanothece hegewaldii]PSF38916.1 Mg-chelatase subunit ChlD [Aphanothece hegewaldii CCALA 016]